MTATVRRAVGIASIPTCGLVGALLVAPGRAELEIHVWLLTMLALALLLALASMRAALPPRRSAFDEALAPRAAVAARPASLAKVERELSMATDTAFDVHYRLRGALRPVASGLLLARAGVDLDRQPDRARALLGDEAWELLRADRPSPLDRTGNGIEIDAVDRIVTAVERVRCS